MQITSGFLILAAVLATGGAVTGTVLLWHRGGRRRLPVRSAGILLCEALLVLSAGLIVNREQDFYPSWQALAGRTGPAAATTVRVAGDLDASFGPGRLRVDWQPAGSAGWHLQAAPLITVPGNYVGPAGAGLSFPALIALGGLPTRAGLVEVSARPAAGTTAGALADLPGRLGVDARVTGHGWALVATPETALLATGLAERNPGRFTALAVTGAPPAGFRCPPAGVAVATAGRRGEPLPCHAARLAGSWAAATGWAVGQTPLPLAAPQVLPTAVIP